MPLRFYRGSTEQRFVGCTHFKTETSEFNCRSPEAYLAFASWQNAITGINQMENVMTKKAGKLTTLAAAAVLGTMFSGSAMAQAVTANVGANAAAAVTPGTGGIVSGVTGIVTGLLGNVTGLLGGLGLGGIL